MMTKNQYSRQLKKPQWITRRSARIILAGGKCERCQSSKLLNVHHKNYIEGRNAWDYPDELLEVLCRSCHRLEHKINVSEKKTRKTQVQLDALSEEYWEWQAKIQELKSEFYAISAELDEKKSLLDGLDDWTSLVSEPAPVLPRNYSAILARALLLFGGVSSIVKKPGEVKNTFDSMVDVGIELGERISKKLG